MESGARRAHGYLKEKITPQTFQYKGRGMSASSGVLHGGCLEGPRDIPTFGTYPVPGMQLPSPEEIKRVSKRFKPNACQPDGRHPRHYSLLSDDTRLVFGKLLLLMEMRGQNPSSVQRLLVQLNHKP
eukprot:271524-Pyramimonas_sp.AAC.1